MDTGFDYSICEIFDEPAIFTDTSLKVIFQNKAADNEYGEIDDRDICCYQHFKGVDRKCPEAIEHIHECTTDLLMSGSQKRHHALHEHKTSHGIKFFLMEKFYNKERGLFLELHTDVTDIVSKHLSNSLLHKEDIENIYFDSFGTDIGLIKQLSGFD